MNLDMIRGKSNFIFISPASEMSSSLFVCLLSDLRKNLYDCCSVRKELIRYFNIIELSFRFFDCKSFLFQPPPWGARAYDAVQLYALGLNKTLQQGESVRDGRTIINNVRSTTLRSMFVNFLPQLISILPNHASIKYKICVYVA